MHKLTGKTVNPLNSNSYRKIYAFMWKRRVYVYVYACRNQVDAASMNRLLETNLWNNKKKKKNGEKKTINHLEYFALCKLHRRMYLTISLTTNIKDETNEKKK